ncbi:MAG TPA: thioredoxin [Candidatus Nanoarchaeia archaeon]|nr:thioredoxin [Candidatus Nanoarchaeia archaeon]
MTDTIDVTGKDNFEKEVINSDKPVLVDFWAPWCQPCLMMAPTLQELAKDLGDKLKIVKLNTEVAENQELASKYQIMSIPNMKLFKDGKVVKEIVGLRPKESLKQELADEVDI